MGQTDRERPVMPAPTFPARHEGDGFALRRFGPGDEAALVAAGQDPGILAFTSLDVLADAEEARSWMRARDEEERAGRGVTVALECDGRAVGALLLLRYSLVEATAEIGYWLLPEARGGGLMSRSLACFVDWAVSSGFQRLYLVTNLDNPATQRVARRCGFAAEGVLRSYGFDRDGRREDVIMFGYVPPGCEAAR